MPSVSTPTPATAGADGPTSSPSSHPEYLNRVISRFGHSMSSHQQSSLSQTLIPALQTSRQGGLESKTPMDDASRPFNTASSISKSDENKRKNDQEARRRQHAVASIAAAATTTTTTSS
ncbi:hypothetical protein NQZ79_g1362 [Umbelopsis isabellina]|nr:hypothetical protein NQZ79_g1362 [Umbelopsis isabellina]